jgi:hypothetical protein
MDFVMMDLDASNPRKRPLGADEQDNVSSSAAPLSFKKTRLSDDHNDASTSTSTSASDVDIDSAPSTPPSELADEMTLDSDHAKSGLDPVAVAPQQQQKPRTLDPERMRRYERYIRQGYPLSWFM